MSTPPQGIESLLQSLGVAPPFSTPPVPLPGATPPGGAFPSATAQEEKPPPSPPPVAVGPPGAEPGPPDVHDLRVPAGSSLTDQSQWGKREDGTLKGRGYLGLLKRADGGVSSELSMSSEIDGREIIYPLLVPTLTREEVEWLLNNAVDPGSVPPSIKAKALAHAKMRMAAGKSPFALSVEEPPL